MALEWRVIRTEPRAEYLAAQELGRDGFEVLFPRVKVTQPRKGHSDMPLFPGYLFLRCDADTGAWPVFRPVEFPNSSSPLATSRLSASLTTLLVKSLMILSSKVRP